MMLNDTPMNLLQAAAKRRSRWPHEVGPRHIGVGRPLGPVARAVLDLLARHSLTAQQVARHLTLSVTAAKYTCSRLQGGGYIRVVDKVKVHGAHKRVGLYSAAALTATEARAVVFPQNVI